MARCCCGASLNALCRARPDAWLHRDAATATRTRSLDGPGGGIEWLSWHPRGHVLLAGSEDFTAWLWNADDGTCMQVFAGHSGALSCGMFTPDGRAVVTGSLDCSLRLWSPRSGECTSTTSGFGFHEAALTCLDCHAVDALVATGSEDGTAKFVNTGTGKVAGTLKGHNGSVECLRFCDVLPFVATGGVDGSLILWDIQVRLKARLAVRCVLTLRKCRPQARGSGATTIRRQSLKLCGLQGRGSSSGASVAAVNSYTHTSSHGLLSAIASGASDGAVRLWDGRSGACVRSWAAHADAVLDLWVSPDGKTVFSGSEDGSVCITRVQ